MRKKAEQPPKKPPGSGPGRPRQFDDTVRQQAFERFMLGDSAVEIAAEIGCTPKTIREWIKAGAWKEDLRRRRETPVALDAEIARLAAKPSTPARAHQIAMLSKARQRLAKLAPTPKPRPTVRNAVSQELLEYAVSDEYGLYDYQKEFLLTEDRFRFVLKARQVGFSFVVGLAILLGAMAGRNQLVVSASEDQAQIILGYVRHHMARLELVAEEDTTNLIRINGVEIRALSTNFRTVQGFHGDVWYDEFAWVRKQRRLWGALTPSITAVGGRVTITTTPFLPSDLAYEIAENKEGRWGQFRRWRITIHDAVAQGMKLPGGIEELRSLFDSETWAMFYECQYAEDGSALLSWNLLSELTVPDISQIRVTNIRAGMDVGRTAHRTAIALLGREQDRVTDKPTDRFALPLHRMEKNMPFAAQAQMAMEIDAMWDIHEWRIDRTGLGAGLAEELQRPQNLGGRAVGIHFDAAKKQRMALNLLKLAERKHLILPNDRDVLAGLHAVKKIVTTSGIRYDAASDELGHGDLFWALGMAADGLARNPSGGGLQAEVW